MVMSASAELDNLINMKRPISPTLPDDEKSFMINNKTLFKSQVITKTRLIHSRNHVKPLKIK
jgi:hypothetical protein